MKSGLNFMRMFFFGSKLDDSAKSSHVFRCFVKCRDTNRREDRYNTTHRIIPKCSLSLVVLMVKRGDDSHSSVLLINFFFILHLRNIRYYHSEDDAAHFHLHSSTSSSWEVMASS